MRPGRIPSVWQLVFSPSAPHARPHARRLVPPLAPPPCSRPSSLSSSSSSSVPVSLPLSALRSAPRPTLPRTRPFTNRSSYHEYNDPRLRGARPLFTSDQLRRVARSPSTHTVVLVAVAAAVVFYFTNIETVPVSGRRRFNCYSAKRVREVGETEAKMIMYELERNGTRILPDWDPRTRMVRRVMAKLIPFSGMGDDSWEIYVIDDPKTANAFVLPGGKVFVFSGILPLVRNDSGLAAVLGHEIAHNVADHVAERMSQSIGVNVLMYSLILLLGAVGLAPFGMQLFGGVLMDVAFGKPMSRLQESEADYIGLMMMAEACYDPREAVAFWRRMDRAQHDQPPEWMSTHPSNQTRIEKIQEWLPKALEKREQSDCRSTAAFADLFRRALDTGVVIQV